MKEKRVEMVRVNTRISATLNEWLEGMSYETGIPKSTIVMLALEEYRKEREVIEKMDGMGVLIERLEQMEKRLQKG